MSEMIGPKKPRSKGFSFVEFEPPEETVASAGGEEETSFTKEDAPSEKPFRASEDPSGESGFQHFRRRSWDESAPQQGQFENPCTF